MASQRKSPATAQDDGKFSSVGRVKLLMVLDALLREGSVGAAADSLGLQLSAVSRMLSEIRDHYGDPIMVRTGRGMRPTALAESLRQGVRRFVVDSEALLLGGDPPAGGVVMPDEDVAWHRRSRLSPPPLSVTRGELLDGMPSPERIAARSALIGANSPPHRRLAKYISQVTPGPGRSRPLTQQEAKDALGIILRGEADPLQIGGLLLVIQYRGATAPELAGFVEAIHDAGRTIALPERACPDLDWPAYVSPRWRSSPWFVHAARLVAMCGYSVLLHGHFGSGPESGKLEAAAEDSSIPVCLTLAEAAQAIHQGGIAYLPVGGFAPQVQSLLAAYPLFEMRTPLNSAIPLANPLAAPAILLGAAEGSNRDLYRSVAQLLGIKELTIIGASRDFGQVAPDRMTTLFRLAGGEALDINVAAVPAKKERVPIGFTQHEYWRAVWTGAARDAFAEATIVNTAAAALLCVSGRRDAEFGEALEQARQAWTRRRKAT